MAETKLAMIHSAAVVVEPMRRLAQEMLPDVGVLNIVDETISYLLFKEGKLTPQVTRNVCGLIEIAEGAGTDAVLLTCSTISRCADVARDLASIPVVKMDDAMAGKAVTLGRAIGVVATAFTTLEPTSRLIEQKAAEAGKRVAIKTTLSKDALAFLKAGDEERHDRLVLEEIERLYPDVDVIVLAQATLDRLAEKAQSLAGIPVLGAPRLALEQVREILDRRRNP